MKGGIERIERIAGIGGIVGVGVMESQGLELPGAWDPQVRCFSFL